MRDDFPMVRRGRRRRWTVRESWRGTPIGMWAWLLQRAAAIGLVVAIALHLSNPFVRPVQAIVLALVLLHGLLGIRSLVLDFGLPVRFHRTLFAAAIALGLIAFAAIWWRWRWY